jgi:hypothetical protein
MTLLLEAGVPHCPSFRSTRIGGRVAYWPNSAIWTARTERRLSTPFWPKKLRMRVPASVDLTKAVSWFRNEQVDPAMTEHIACHLPSSEPGRGAMLNELVDPVVSLRVDSGCRSAAPASRSRTSRCWAWKCRCAAKVRICSAAAPSGSTLALAALRHAANPLIGLDIAGSRMSELDH